MKKCVMMVCGLVVFGLLVGAITRPASAVPNFKKAFDEAYAPAGSPLAKASETAKCNICHVGEKKKEKNEYGNALGQLIKKADKDAKEKIMKALKDVEDKHSNPKDPKSPTFGENIKAGKLPIGG